MKTLIIFIVTLCNVTLIAAQDENIGSIDGTMRAGWATKISKPVVATGFYFNAHGFGITPEMIIPCDNSSGVNMGIKLSYKYKFIQAGYGRYFDWYTTDKYDSYKNGYSNSYFVAFHWKFNVERMIEKWFVEYSYNDRNGSLITIGVREKLFNIQ